MLREINNQANLSPTELKLGPELVNTNVLGLPYFRKVQQGSRRFKMFQEGARRIMKVQEGYILTLFLVSTILPQISKKS